MTIDDDDAPESPPPPPPPPMRPSVRAFLSRKDTVSWVFMRVRKKVPHSDGENEAQTALQKALEARWPDSDVEKVHRAVLHTIVKRHIADFHEQRRARREKEGPMPRPRMREDEVGRRVIDEEAPDGPIYDPTADTPWHEGVLMERYLEGAVDGDAGDEETYGWMIAWSDGDLTYEQIAQLTGLKLSTVHMRVARFKERHLPGFKKWRNTMFLLLLLGGLIVVLGIVALLQRLRAEPKVEDIRATPDVPQLAPSGSATGEPVEPPPAPEPSFNNAWPTNPDARAPDPFDDKPPRADPKPKTR